jgi:hypothetical protein
MNVSALSGASAVVAKTTVAKVELATAQVGSSQSHLTVLPSGDTVQISAEARSLSAQAAVSLPAENQTVAAPLLTVVPRSARSLQTTPQNTTPVLERSAVQNDHGEQDSVGTGLMEIISREEPVQNTREAQQVQQADQTEQADQANQMDQTEEEKQAAQEDETRNAAEIASLETEIGSVRQDITFLVGRAAVNETVREELHEKKSELSELMVELFQLESVSTNSLR